VEQIAEAQAALPQQLGVVFHDDRLKTTDALGNAWPSFDGNCLPVEKVPRVVQFDVTCRRKGCQRQVNLSEDLVYRNRRDGGLLPKIAINAREGALPIH
jgi:hypothetical protein